MAYAFIILFSLLGIILGSFYNVVGLRLPQQISFATERSVCPSCYKQLSWYELIPLLSFFIQGGKCRHCKKKISIIYPMIEFITGFLFGFSYVLIGFNLELITALLLISMLMVVIVSDISYMLIPNKLLVFFLPFFIMMRIVVPLDPWWSPILGFVIGLMMIAVIILVSKGGMGGGDMKLFGLLGIVLGYKKVILSLFLASLLGAVIGGVLLLLKVIKRKQPIPFGPYIVAASLIAYFYGDSLISWYIDFFN